MSHSLFYAIFRTEEHLRNTVLSVNVPETEGTPRLDNRRMIEEPQRARRRMMVSSEVFWNHQVDLLNDGASIHAPQGGARRRNCGGYTRSLNMEYSQRCEVDTEAAKNVDANGKQSIARNSHLCMECNDI